MTEKKLDLQAMPRTTPEHAEQVQHSAERRRLAMEPGYELLPPEKDTPVDHYLGDGEDVVFGPPPFNPTAHVRRSS
ncbi:MAG: hypothetical protein ACK46Q_07880 [Hyphomonas sp.]